MCTILLNMFISLLYMFRASMCPSLGENYYIYATLVFVTLCRWRLVCRLDWIRTADQTPPIQSDKHQCRVDTVIFSWWWAHGCPKHVEKRNKHIKQNYASNWTYLRKDPKELWSTHVFLQTMWNIIQRIFFTNGLLSVELALFLHSDQLSCQLRRSQSSVK